jgi:hypothetical protein
MTSATSTDSLWRRIYYSRFRDVLRGRPDARLNWRQIIASANLPAELATAVTQVVGKSRLWRSEKASVATELVSHFQDGLEAGQSPQDLLMAFGDSQATAQLIGRAKRRGRPVGWQIFLYGWMTLAGLGAVYVMVGLWMSVGRPTVKTDYLAALNKTALAVPDKERAWPEYRDAFMAMGLQEDSKDKAGREFLDNEAKPGEPKWAEKEKFLSEHADSIAKLREAAKFEKLGVVASTSRAEFSEKDRELFGIHLTPEELKGEKELKLEDRWLMSTLLPDLQRLGQAGSILGADARRAAEAGDGNIAYADVIALFGVSHHAEEMPLLINVAVADRIQGYARSAIRDIISEKPELWTDAQLRDLAHKMAASQLDWSRGIEGERSGFYDGMQRVYTDNGKGDGRLALHISKDKNLFQMLASINQGEGAPSDTLLANSGLAMMTLPAANMVVASRKEMVDVFDRATNAAQARMSEPYWKQKAEPPLDEFLNEESGPFGKFRYLFVRIMLPSYDNLLKRIVMTNSEQDGVYLGLALELYHRQNHKWPESLAELAPKWLPEVPVDRVTGQSLHYKVVDDQPLIYSVGLDEDDDKGRPVPNEKGTTLPWTGPHDAKVQDGDWVIWTTAKSG